MSGPTRPSLDEEESADAAEVPGLDLRPRPRPERARPAGVRRWAWAGVLLVLAAVAFLVVRNLAGATVFFYNVDEAVAQKATQGRSPFKMQGTVVCRSVRPTADGVDFQVAYGGATVDVRSVGAPPQLFQEGIPVLLEGSWSADGSRFESGVPIVKHTEQYIEKNNDRLTEAGNASDAKLTMGGAQSANLCGA